MDHRQRRSQHFHIKFFQNAQLGQFHGRVEAGLSPQGRQDGLGPLPLNNFGHHLGGNGFDISAMGRFRVGHNGGGIAVNEHNLKPLLHEGLTGLGAGVVEFAGLADNDGAGADEENLFDVGSFGHSFIGVRFKV